jgi:hypothetical protein
MAKLIAFVSSFIAVFLVIGMAAYFRYYAPAGTFLHPELDAATVVREIRSLNSLAEVRYGIQQTLTVDGVVVVVRGQATAAVNLADVTQYDIGSLKGRQATIRLPPPVLTSVTAEWASPKGYLPVPASANPAIRETALSMGILEEGRRRARQTVSALLGALGITQIRFLEE